MQLPSKSQAFRIIHRAASTTQTLGGLSIAVSLVFGCCTMGFVTNGFSDDDAILLRGVAIILGASATGAIMIFLAGFLEYRRRWAAITLLVLTSLAAAVAGILLWIAIAALVSIAMPDPYIIGFAFVLALLLTCAIVGIVRLAHALRVMNHPAIWDTGTLGFTPILPTPAEPISPWYPGGSTDKDPDDTSDLEDPMQNP